MIAWLEKQSQTFTKKDVDDAYLKGVCDAKHELEKLGSEHEGNPDKTANELHKPFVSADEKEQPKKKRPKMLNMFYALLLCLSYVLLAVSVNILSHDLFGLYCGIDSITFSMVFTIVWVLCYIHISED